MISKEFVLGIKKSIPFMIGIVPFGIAYGIMASQAKLSLIEVTFMSMVVFAGSAQFMAVGMLIEGVGFSYIVFSTFLINLRHLLMGVSLAPYFRNLKSWWLWLLAFGMGDEPYACTISHFQKNNIIDGKGEPLFMLGSEIGMYIFWVSSSFFGALFGQSIKDPLSWGIDFAMPATFLCIIIPQIKSLKMFLIFFVSGICAIIGHISIPGKWYIIIATIIGTLMGTLFELQLEKSKVIKRRL